MVAPALIRPNFTFLLNTTGFVARFTAADLAHQLQRDLERGVFSRQTLRLIGVAIAVAVFALGQGGWSVAVLSLRLAGSFTYGPARATFRYSGGMGVVLTAGPNRPRSRSTRFFTGSWKDGFVPFRHGSDGCSITFERPEQ